jgi:hypothetical protein
MPRVSRSLVTGLVAWFFTTLAVSSALSMGGWLWGRRQAERMRRGWLLEPVVVTTRAMRAGTVLKASDVRPGQLPDQFVTTSLVPVTDLGTLVGRRLTVDVSPNDALGFAHFAPRPHPLARCVETARLAAGDPPTDPGVDAFLARLEAEVSRRVAHASDGGTDGQP